MSSVAAISCCCLGMITRVTDASAITLTSSFRQWRPKGSAVSNCLDRGVRCVTSSSSSRGQRRLENSAALHSPQRPSHDRRRGSAISQPVGLLSPNATSVGFSVNTEDIAQGNEILTPGVVDNLGEQSSILPDDLVRYPMFRQW
jgi:hypothetical protein